MTAAGSQLAYQSAYGSDTTALNEAVFFEYSDTDYSDHGHGEQESYNCTLPDDFDDQSDEDSQTGSITDNECYVNGFKHDCNDVAEHPEDYEVEPDFVPADKFKHSGLYFGKINAGAANWVDDEDTGSVDFDSNIVNVQANGHLELPVDDGIGESFLNLPARRLFRVEVMTLRKTMENNISDSCKSYIANLINTANTENRTVVSTDALEIFDKTFVNRVDKYSGIWGLTGGGGTSYAYSNGPALGMGLSVGMYSRMYSKIDGNGHAYNNFYSNTEYDALDSHERSLMMTQSIAKFVTSVEGAFAAVHESIHNAFGASDEKLAVATAKLFGKTLNIDMLPKEDSPENIQKRVLITSGIWDHFLHTACGIKSNRNDAEQSKYFK